MRTNIFTSGTKSSFAKRSRRMARMVSVGAGSLAIVFCLFIFFYFESDEFVRSLSCVLPIIYLASIIISFTKITNRTLYNIIFYIYIFSSLVILTIAYQLSFDVAFVVLMLTAYNIILFALPKAKQILIYFGVVFIPLVLAIIFSDVSIGLTLLITVSFGYVFLLSYVIAQQKQQLNLRNMQNAEILKALVNNTNDSIFLVDYFSNEIKDVNEKTKVLFGLDSLEEVISKKYYELFADENFIPSNRNEIAQQISELGHYETKVLLKKKDGTQFSAHLLLSPFKAVRNNYYLIQIKEN
ncbi:MAG: PAS domain S-box protein [Flavobacteriales bacterium]|nr:PAS domain S-box protein [Flavobacteriales bacterium]